MATTLPLPRWGSHHCLVPDDRHSFLYAIGSLWNRCEVVFSNGFLRGAEGTVSTSRHLQITTEEWWNKPIVSRFAVRQQQRHKGYGFPLATGSPWLSFFYCAPSFPQPFSLKTSTRPSPWGSCIMWGQETSATLCYPPEHGQHPVQQRSQQLSS